MALGRIRLTGHIPKSRGVEPRGAWRTIESLGLTLVRSGTGSRTTPTGTSEPIVGPSLILTLPGEPHWFGPRSGQAWDELFVVVEGALSEWLTTKVLGSGQARVWAIGDPARANSLFQELIETQRLSLVLDLLYNEWPHVSDEQAWAENVAQRLATSRVTVSEIARGLGISPAELRSRFLAARGLTPSRYRIERRLMQAQDLLQLTGLTVREISQRLEYADEFVFSRQFKLETGMSPSEFRRLSRYRSGAMVEGSLQ